MKQERIKLRACERNSYAKLKNPKWCRTILFALLIALSANTMAQNEHTSVRGVVSDAVEGYPMPGVSVIIKGTTTGVMTGSDGAYELNASDGDILVFSFIGMQSQEIKVTRHVLNVKMKQEVTDISEVVVVGYGVKKKALVTGANINVKGDQIEAMNTSSAMEALQGVTPGINISRNNGAPGAGTKVTIRGMGTIGNAKPLYIVDGVAVDNIDYLNSSDIEAIDVLKDAASAAIYGSRAANGVVLVTTKKGKKGSKASVTYDAYYGVQNIYKNASPLNAQEYMYIMDEGRTNDGLAPNDWHKMLTNNAWLDNNYPGKGVQLGEDIWNRLQHGWQGTNWVDEMTQKDAPVQSHAINITGAGDDIVYALGISYFDQKSMLGGNLIDAGYKRITARMNTEMILFKNEKHSIIKIGENLTFTNIQNRSVATGDIYYNDLHNALVQNPLMPAYWKDSPDKFQFTPILEGVAADQTNPLAQMYYRSNYNWQKANTIIGNVYTEVQPMKDLKFRSSFGINSWFGHSRAWTPTYILGTLYQSTADAAQQDMYQGVNYTWSNTISYDKKIGNHKLSFLLGNEVLKNKLAANVGGKKINTTFGDPEYAYLDNVQKVSVTGIDTWGRDNAAQGGGLLSYIARASYNYKEKYMLDVIVRADGSSNFAKGKRWGTFPSFSAGWNFTEEEFMKNIKFINYGKLRASWGQNGNQAINNFIYTSNISYLDPGYFFGDNKPVSGKTAIPANVPNKNVSWETSEQLDFGLDTRYLNSRLTFTFDWYQKNTKDWLVIAPIQGTAGAAAPYINGGSIRNSGVEFIVGWNDEINKFKYGASISGAYNANKVTAIDNAEGIITGTASSLAQGTPYVSRVEVGKPIGYFYGYKTAGILQNQNDVDAYVGPTGKPYFPDERPGDVRFVDQNGDGVIDENDKVMLGDPNPHFELGIQLNAEYKGFYTNATFTGKFGMQVMQSYRSFTDKFTQNYTTEIFDRWHGEGTSNLLPRLSAGSTRNTNFVSDIYMQNADYLRLGNLTFGYKFDELLKSIKWVESAKLYVAVNNLCTFTSFKGMDPEVSFGQNNWESGIDLGLYPLPRTVMLGFNVTF